jgi:CIC family chloride channel protein
MIFEMTGDYSVIIPITVSVALSYGLRTMLQPHSIYTLKLARRGHTIPSALQANFYLLKTAKDVMDARFATVPAIGTRDDVARAAATRPEVSCFLVEGPEGILGFLTRDQALQPPAGDERAVKAIDLADRMFITVGEAEPLLDVLSRLRAEGASVAMVTDGSVVRGLIGKQQIADAVIAGVELFAD